MKRGHGGIREGHPPGLIDFSSNLCPWGPPEAARRLLAGGLLAEAVSYPDPAYRSLRETLGRYAGCPPACVYPANGSEEIFFWLCRQLAPRSTVVIGPTYSEYGLAAEAAGSELRRLTRRPEKNFALDLEEVAAATAGADLVFVCNPDNPTGGLLSRGEVEDIRKRLKPGAVLLVDEAFMDFLEEKEGRTAVPLVSEGLWVTRSLTKFFSLAGLRLGYLVAPAETVETLEDSTPLWRVNRIAEAAALAALGDEGYIREVPARTAAEREHFTRSLEATGMLKVYPASANFLLAEITGPGMTAESLQRRLLERGYLIRDASDFHGLGERFIRLAVLDRERNQALTDELAEVMSVG